MNIDPNTQVALQQFQSFFNFLNNPADYKKMLADTQATLDSMKLHVEAYTTVEDANSYLAQSQQTLKDAQGHADTIVAAAKQEAEDRSSQLDQRSADLDVREKQLNDLSVTQSQIKVDLATLSSSLQAKAMDLAKKESDLNTQIGLNNDVAADLAAKQAALAQVFK